MEGLAKGESTRFITELFILRSGAKEFRFCFCYRLFPELGIFALFQLFLVAVFVLLLLDSTSVAEIFLTSQARLISGANEVI